MATTRKISKADFERKVIAPTSQQAKKAGWLSAKSGDFCVEMPTGGMIAFFHLSPAANSSISLNIGIVNRLLNATSLKLVDEHCPKSALKHLRLAFGCNLSRLKKNISIQLGDSNLSSDVIGGKIFEAADREAQSLLTLCPSIESIRQYYQSLDVDSGAPFIHVQQVLMTIAISLNEPEVASGIVGEVYNIESEAKLKKTIWDGARDYLHSVRSIN